MKLILLLGTSLSAAGLAAGFAVIANQALSRESAVISLPYRAIQPARIVPDLALGPASPKRGSAPQVVAAASDPLPLAHFAASRNGAMPPKLTTHRAAPALFNAAATNSLAERPPRRPLQMAYSDSLPGMDIEFEPIPAARFENLPLIGVYR